MPSHGSGYGSASPSSPVYKPIPFVPTVHEAPQALIPAPIAIEAKKIAGKVPLVVISV